MLFTDPLHAAPVDATVTDEVTLVQVVDWHVFPTYESAFAAAVQQTSAVVVAAVPTFDTAEIGTVAAASELAKGWLIPTPTSRVHSANDAGDRFAKFTGCEVMVWRPEEPTGMSTEYVVAQLFAADPVAGTFDVPYPSNSTV
jgi:hypothetical protein